MQVKANFLRQKALIGYQKECLECEEICLYIYKMLLGESSDQTLQAYKRCGDLMKDRVNDLIKALKEDLTEEQKEELKKDLEDK